MCVFQFAKSALCSSNNVLSTLANLYIRCSDFGQNKCSTHHIAQAKSEVQDGGSKHSVTYILADTHDSNGIPTAVQNISESGNMEKLMGYVY